ncbi:hypothetical protein ScoT_63280 [Streptomyces albidoflavus]|uniref:Uncharacterized protein n=1 Tax=Streptomyces albidoflavus TaxID=1886 RepID=A0AA37C4J2_9ACTN|nr:hypothetical protein ScoT_63280 [Streptomyces albidoflavus]
MVGGELAFAVLGAGLGEPTVDLNGVSVAPEGFTGGGARPWRWSKVRRVRRADARGLVAG